MNIYLNECQDFSNSKKDKIIEKLKIGGELRYGGLISDLEISGSKNFESNSIRGMQTSKWQLPNWVYAGFGAILFIVSVLFLIRPFGNHSIRLTSLAVLPFENLTGNTDLEYFVSGMHASLIGEISKLRAVRVISKTTSNAYKHAEKSISEIASVLQVDVVVEASVLGLGDSVIIQVKLMGGFPEERQIWFQDYVEEKSRILNLYNQVTKEISREINVVLTPQEESLLATARTVNPEAYEAYLKGQYYWERLDPESIPLALEAFQLAIQIDPDWADPYAGLANSWGILGKFEVLPEL